MSFVRNAWYVAAWASDLHDGLIARTLLDQPVVLFRRQDGTPAALEDLCPHRFLPLSMGELRGDAIQCGYHGMTFDSDGRCLRVPGQDRIPTNARVKTYPVAEHMGMIWIWMGDPALARRADLFDLPQFHQPDWEVGFGDALQIDAHYLSLADNLCDPAHVSFVHKSTLGSAASEDIPVTSERHGNTVLTHRWILDSPPVGFFQAFGNFSGNVDRWHYYYLHAPSTAIIDFGSVVAGSGAEDRDRDNRDTGARVFSCHFLTPRTATSTVDHWLHVRNFDSAKEHVSAAISEQLRFAFDEDKVILEAIQQRETRFPERSQVRIACDAGPTRLRKIIDEMLAAEQQHTFDTPADGILA